MALEKRKNKTVIIETKRSFERITEDAFLSSVHDRIFEGLADSLEEAGFTPAQERECRDELSRLSLEEINGVLSMPYELRKTRLPRLFERVKEGMQIAEMVALLAKEGVERGYTLGYHMSNSDIPEKTGKSGVISWTVDGKEKDHRDNDLPMAYYSTSLSRLYGAKIARYMYVVRAETGPQSTHKQDNDGSWGRATKLDIVEKFDYQELMAEARKRANGLADTN